VVDLDAPGSSLRHDGAGVLVTVLVPVLDEAVHLREAAAAMLAQDLGDRVEYLFIDGGSADATPQILADLAADPRVRLLANPDRITPAALNRGLAAARGRYVARMDAHTLYPPDYLRTGVARLEQGDVAHVSGPQIATGRAGWSRSIARALQSRAGTGAARFRRESTSEFEIDSGFTGVWERETLRRHDGWDEGWPINQDAELAARIRAAGGRIVCLPPMAARYVPRDGIGPLARQYYRYGLYRSKTSRRHPGSLRAAHLMPPALVATLAAALAPTPLRRPARAGLAAYAAVLAATAAEVGRSDGPGEAARVAVVLLVMHGAWGGGMWRGALRA
jgi:succinoglycan biosynthesis protein ExoA